LPRPEAAAERLRKALQGVFEKTYSFDLEDLRKKGKALSEHIKFLESIPAGTSYMIQYTAQVALDGHVIPLDEASLRIMRRLGLSQVSSDGTQEICAGLDRVILKKSSLAFAAQLHHFAAGYYDVPDSPELLSQLSAIDGDAVGRSWTCPIVATPPVKPVVVAVPASVCGVCEKEVEAKQKTPLAKPSVAKETVKETPVAKPAKPVPKPTPKPVSKEKLPTKPAKKPLKKSVPVKPTAEGPKKPVKSPVKIKKTPSAKVFQVKQAQNKKVPPKKLVKPFSTKKKVVVKKSLAKPNQKLKTVSPTKALRKKKPK
jgi:endonuclease-3